jgi:transcriptional regulator with XRE-family HTH domain
MSDDRPAADRLKELRERSGLSVRAVAEALGLGDRHSTYSSRESSEKAKGRFIKPDHAYAYLPVFVGRGTPPITREEVLALAGIAPLDTVPAHEVAQESPGDRAAPGYLILHEYHIAAAAGDGAIPTLDGNGHARILAEWTVPKALLPAQYQNGHIGIIRVQGDSMVPEIMPEERVMVDTSQTFVGPEGIYLIWESESLLVKRVQKIPGRKLRIVSRNPEYQPYEQPMEEVRVIGRVIGRWEWK